MSLFVLFYWLLPSMAFSIPIRRGRDLLLTATQNNLFSLKKGECPCPYPLPTLEAGDMRKLLVTQNVSRDHTHLIRASSGQALYRQHSLHGWKLYWQDRVLSVQKAKKMSPATSLGEKGRDFEVCIASASILSEQSRVKNSARKFWERISGSPQRQEQQCISGQRKVKTLYKLSCKLSLTTWL